MIGFLITLLESLLLGEIHKVFYEYEFNLKIGLLWAGFSLTLAFFTSIASFFIRRCSASMFNISLVSQIFWSYLVEVISGDSSPRGYEYYIGFVVIIAGVFIFNRYPVVTIPSENEKKRSSDSFYSGNKLTQQLLLESGNSNSQSKIPTQYDNISEKSGGSAFSSSDKKFNYYRNQTVSNKANKYLNNN